jgi:hypothetical protein
MVVLVVSPICFLRGTRVRTPKGEPRVEDVAIGELIQTLRGPLPIKWIGRQLFKKLSESWHKSVLPVRISRGALADGIPHADLYLSPGHRIYLDSVLIEVRLLINGRSIVQAMPHNRNEIEYFHIELEDHEVIFAEGAAAETFQATTGREHFNNFVEYERLYGVESRAAMLPYAPAIGYNGGRSELKRVFGRAVFPFVDIRDPVQMAYDRIVARELVD